MKVLVAGMAGVDADHVRRTLDRHHRRTPFSALVTPESFAAARLWADERGVPCSTWAQDAERHGAAADPIMNQKMLAQDRPAMVVAFPGDRATGDLVNRAMMAGIPVYVEQGGFKKVSPRRLA